MIAPVKTDIEIVSPWGMRTLSYINGGKPMMHPGVDIHAPEGTAIVAPGRCKILRVGTGQIYHEHYTVAQSLDCDTVFKFIHCGWTFDGKEGTLFEEGEQLAVSDGSGTMDGNGGTAPHLHFETWHGGQGWAECGGVNYNPTDFFAHYTIDFTIRA